MEDIVYFFQSGADLLLKKKDPALIMIIFIVAVILFYLLLYLPFIKDRGLFRGMTLSKATVIAIAIGTIVYFIRLYS